MSNFALSSWREKYNEKIDQERTTVKLEEELDMRNSNEIQLHTLEKKFMNKKIREIQKAWLHGFDLYF